tara:strand:- start:1002 stop:1334 length:333 start_codon:yes stop_codon:yes gene_type:complete
VRRRRVRRPIGEADSPVDVAQQIERQVELLLEGLVVLGRIEADAEDDRVAVVELLDSITESVALNRSTGRIGLRVPPEHHRFAPVTVESDRFAILGLHREAGRPVADAQH